VLDEMNSTLESVKDKSSADAAKPKLKSIAEKMKSIKERADKLGKDDKADEEIKKKYEGQMKEKIEKMMKESMRVATVDGGADLLKELGDAMKQLK
jgi:hypothetical protein